MDAVNTQLVTEKQNSVIQRIKSTLSYMSLENLMHRCNFFFGVGIIIIIIVIIVIIIKIIILITLTSNQELPETFQKERRYLNFILSLHPKCRYESASV